MKPYVDPEFPHHVVVDNQFLVPKVVRPLKSLQFPELVTRAGSIVQTNWRWDPPRQENFLEHQARLAELWKWQAFHAHARKFRRVMQQLKGKKTRSKFNIH